MNEREIADQVQKRAEELLGEEEYKPLDDFFVKQCLDANERGDGVMYATINRDKFLYNTTPDKGEWYLWKGNVWAPDEKKGSVDAVEKCALEYQRVFELLKNEIEEKGIEKGHAEGWKLKLGEKYKQRIDRLRTATGAGKVLYWAPIVHPDMACREDGFDKQPWLLPVRNGVINLKTGVLEAGRQEDKLVRCLDIDYDPRADYTMWQDIVDEISNDIEVADFIKRSFGYAITGFSHEQYIWVFVGPGRNGKGVLFSLMKDVLGPYYDEVNRGMLLEQRNEPSINAASEHLYSLLGKRFVVGAETNKGQKIDAAAVKALTGEESIKCRPLFKGELLFYPTHSLFLQTNHLPYGLTKDFSLVQRLLLIEFPFMYVNDIEYESKKSPEKIGWLRKKDPKLKEKLRKCRKGILRWLVEGCLEWQAVGLKPPQSIIDGVTRLENEEDYIGQFIKACLVHHPDKKELRLQCTTMYNAFKWWWSLNMDDTEKRIPAMKTINKSIRDRGFIVDEAGGRTWIFRHALNPEIALEVDEFVKKSAKS